MTPRGESGSKSIVRTYIRSDRGESDVQGSAPDIVAPQVVKRTHGLLVHSSDALVDGVPLLVGSSTLREDLNQPLSLLKQKRSGKWDVGHFIAWITPPPPKRNYLPRLAWSGKAAGVLPPRSPGSFRHHALCSTTAGGSESRRRTSAQRRHRQSARMQPA